MMILPISDNDDDKGPPTTNEPIILPASIG